MTLWLISDTHFGHEAMYRFLKFDGVTRVREAFTSATEADECMVDLWNRLVKPSDHVYHLGDVAMRREHLQIVKRLNGKKRLILGNHDIYDFKSYREVGFEKVFGSRVLNNTILSHIPLHPDSIPRWANGNIHGHIHANPPMTGGRYLNVSVEAIDYSPITLEDAVARLKRMEEALVK